MKLALEGLLIKPKKKEGYWGVGVPLLEIYSQGKNKSDAMRMIQNAVEEAAEDLALKIHVIEVAEGKIAISTNNFAALMAFMLRQQRLSNSLSLREIAARLGSKSPNSYKRYENGNVSTSLEKLAELMGAVRKDKYLFLKTG